jgi:hypothetical protein
MTTIQITIDIPEREDDGPAAASEKLGVTLRSLSRSFMSWAGMEREPASYGYDSGPFGESVEVLVGDDIATVVTDDRYEALTSIVDRAKNDDEVIDTAFYVADILTTLGLKVQS